MTFADKLDRLVVEEWKDEGRPMPWVEFKQAILQAAIAAEEERQAYYAAMGESDPDASADFEAVGAQVRQQRNDLESQVTILDRLLTELPASSVIERLSLECRKQEVLDELAGKATA